jgi:prepilin-type N-terminal cleavage/methylation domain-containing protein
MSSRRVIAPPCAGFTLVELMLAVALMGLIMAMIFGAFFAVIHSKADGEANMTADEEGRAIIYQMSAELRGVVQTPIFPSAVLLVGEAHSSGGETTDSVTFATLDVLHRRSLLGAGAEEIVAYSLEPSSRTRGEFLLARSQRSALLTSTQGAHLTAPVVLSKRVRSLHLRYFDGTRWNESWNSRRMPALQALPVAVSIELQMAGPNGSARWFSTLVAPAMAVMQR